MDEQELSQNILRQSQEKAKRLQALKEKRGITFDSDTIRINKNNYQEDWLQGNGSGAYYEGLKDKITVHYFKVDTAGMGPIDGVDALEQAEFMNTYYNSDAVLVHENKHRDNEAKGLERIISFDVSQRQAIKLQEHNEVSANIAGLLNVREKYLQTGKLDINHPMYQFYEDAVLNGKIDPHSNDKAMFDKEMHLIVNGVKDYWDKHSHKQYDSSHFNFSRIRSFAKDNDQQYQKGLDICYTYGGVNLKKYMDKDFELSPNLEKQVSDYENSAKAYLFWAVKPSFYLAEYGIKPIVHKLSNEENKKEVFDGEKGLRRSYDQVTKNSGKAPLGPVTQQSRQENSIEAVRQACLAHRNDFAEYKGDMSLSQWANLRMNNVISWDMKRLLKEREEYAMTGNVEVFSEDFAFYASQVKEGKIKPEESSITAGELRLIVNGVKNKNADYDQVISQDMRKAAANLPYPPQGNLQRYQELSQNMYNFAGIDFKQFMEGEIRLPETQKVLNEKYNQKSSPTALLEKNAKENSVADKLRALRMGGNTAATAKHVPIKFTELERRKLAEGKLYA